MYGGGRKLTLRSGRGIGNALCYKAKRTEEETDYGKQHTSSAAHRHSGGPPDRLGDDSDSLVHLVLHAFGGVLGGRDRMGHFLAQEHWAGFVLDTSAHDGLFVRRAGGDCMRVPDSFNHLSEGVAVARR